MMLLEEFKKKLGKGETVCGPFMKTTDPAFVESAGYAGFDFAILDMEHGPVSFENLQNLIRAAMLGGIIPVVRTPDQQEIHIGRALDLGALGVQVPQVATARQAQAAVNAARFHPMGGRGMCRFVRAAAYSSTPAEEYFKLANQTLLILQLEGQEAIANLDGILEVDGIDILFIGPYDLSQSLGHPGETDHPAVTGAMQKIVEKSSSKGKVLGTFTDTMDAAGRWKNSGIQYLSYSVDVGIFTTACKDLVSGLSGL